VWYPAENTSQSDYAPYIPEATKVSEAISELLHIPKALLYPLQFKCSNALVKAPVNKVIVVGTKPRIPGVLQIAYQYIGVPYVWGGTSLTNGCDCSGFTMGVLGNYGVGLPHYSGSQAQMGVKIDSSQMRPGDLIFYSNKRGTINHVAMYIGNGQIVHAASRRSGIKISQWNYRTPTTIRNVIGD